MACQMMWTAKRTKSGLSLEFRGPSSAKLIELELAIAEPHAEAARV